MSKEEWDNDPRLTELDQGFDKILNAVERNEGLTRKEWMTYYDTCYKLCTGVDRHEAGLYNHIAADVTKHVDDLYERKLKDLREESLLREYLKIFDIYQNSCRAVSSISHILARFWLPAQRSAKKDTRDVIPLSYIIWRDHAYRKLASNLQSAVFQYIEQDRNGQTKDKSLVRDFIESVGCLGVDDPKKFYEEEFENHFIKLTKEYYSKESSGFIAANSISDYMTKAETRIKQETANCDSFYFEFKETKTKLEQALNWALIENHMEHLQSSFEAMLTADKIDDMTRFYFLLSRVTDGLGKSSKTFETHLAAVGGEIVKEQAAKTSPQQCINAAIPFIKKLMELYQKYSGLVDRCFQKNTLFKESLDRGFVTVMNLPSGKFFSIPRLLYYYLDWLLKGKGKTNDDEIMERLEDSVRLFSYFRDKDEFGEYAKRGLSKRLLAGGKGFNELAEKNLISLLKAQSGNAFTRHMQGMFTDAEGESVQRIKNKFQEFNGGSEKVDGVQLSVQVLNECYWPIGAKEKFPVPGKPEEMSNCVIAFEKFYKSESAGSKKLNWLYSHGTVSLLCKVGKLRCEVVVTPLQAAILCLFNSAEKLTTTEIMGRLWPGEERKSKLRLSKSSSSLFDIDLMEILAFAIQPLSSWDKFQVLQKDPVEPKDQIGESDTFSVKLVNHKKRKIAFPPGSAKAQIQENTVDKKNVIAQRKFEIDAAMVRVMKARNVCTWNDLQVQVVEHLKARFMPVTKMMKERLESLIERGFIERDTDDTNRLKYIA